MIAAVLLSVALADLPVHCLRHQVVGAWRLHLGALAKERSTCGHARPDTESKQPPLKLNGTTSWDVHLHDPNVASADGANGTWTMVYDEGFYADVGGRTLFAFNHFLLSDPNSVQWFESRVHGKKVYRSVCGRTEVGWYHDKASDQWGCFYAERTDVNPDAHHDYLSFLHVVEDPAYHAPLSLAQHEAVARDINAVADGWTAAAYASYGDLSLADLNQRAGTARYNVRQESASFLSARDVDARRHVVRAEPAKEAKSALPEEFTWRSHNGSDWLDPVMDQGECGSCYAVSSTNMMTARHRVAMNDPKAPSFSVGFSLYCADVNQGCNGGYPFLTAMWSQNVGLVQSSCTGRYRVDSNLQCENFVKHAESIKNQQLDKCMAGHEARVTDFSYVGGYYGGCSEEGMKEALLEGPITVAIEPAMDFMYYKSGVYRSVKKDQKVTKPSGEWVKVDHAVLLVGWGVDKTDAKSPRPYWLVQNSWGPDWGEGGYIRMARGENESGVEFQALAATVKPAQDLPLHAFLAEARK